MRVGGWGRLGKVVKSGEILFCLVAKWGIGGIVGVLVLFCVGIPDKRYKRCMYLL